MLKKVRAGSGRRGKGAEAIDNSAPQNAPLSRVPATVRRPKASTLLSVSEESSFTSRWVELLRSRKGGMKQLRGLRRTRASGAIQSYMNSGTYLILRNPEAFRVGL